MNKFKFFFSRLNIKRKNNVKKFFFVPSKREKFVTPYLFLSMSGLMFGLSFAFVPLYQLFCQSTGYGGTTQKTFDISELFNKKVNKDRLIEVNFTSQSNMPWAFKPEQKSIIVKPGETVLAFYKAKNLLDKPVIGIALYHVLPDEAGLYFNKIQCFCFEEQMLNANEEIDLPVLFFIDPEILNDSRLKNLEKITLSYIFFESDSDIPEEYQHLSKAIVPKKKAEIQVI
ncbi:cytochrome c oxidase assembly protein COX11, putative [Plasmodium berghei]|uniref:Cytochrome c oxidase assembly protein COX11, putative n=2 Tax=Plasmodium berghei TaxID=5821 RepID=A0A509AP11_PLABA|nr:cytochrome c oxidase assembly protein COX11, putative [Plasmodium berghei ANKA]CXI87389.1 cytochrome c oxidase assembly protein COX11, putative [Plasmodium berghei]SCL95783.1 cytochrome c oxidase assembly protein COX11, putative [Plasmodium berghei]SCM16284.1 cytochrome c oxidase assembly protein COX11, putative [Plasmodium berghei]SCM18080.1 cytochrome c oxidase assembly protein COX11, putative [Plasmodium berghei]SCN27506.1 cytochrome c oxidase assembly protein COX11, putative [Plasmodium|eukprot:XP_034423162.1 cytochrome c oxidase assembly protein COX11, putative [Plasmodium berghei ANKA]